MVDLSLVLDVSSSIGSKWGAVRDASRAFVDAFDPAHDRLSLLTFGNGAQVLEPMPSSRGFDKPGMIAAVPQNLPGGSTAMVQGLYRGWDELRSVPERHAVDPARDRALHRRRVQQRARLLRCGADGNQGAPDV